MAHRRRPRHALHEVRHRQVRPERSRLYRERASARTVDGELSAQHPNATVDDIQDASRDVRVSTYSWLFKTRTTQRRTDASAAWSNCRRTRGSGKSWRALGYPFEIGDAIVCGGRRRFRRPAGRARATDRHGCERRQEFADRKASPRSNSRKARRYETHFAHEPDTQSPQLPPEIVDVVQHLLRDVVLGGTATRLADGMHVRPTADVRRLWQDWHRRPAFRSLARGGRLIESRKVNRTATFVFVDRQPLFRHIDRLRTRAVCGSLQLYERDGRAVVEVAWPDARAAVRADAGSHGS